MNKKFMMVLVEWSLQTGYREGGALAHGVVDDAASKAPVFDCSE